jgi:acetyl esterase/lipase
VALGAAVGLTPPVARAADPAPGAFAVRERLDVRYHPGRDRQTLDVFSPQGAEGRPVVLFVHGGAWVFGDKNLFGLYRRVGRYFARNGVVAVLVNYRLSPKVRHPEHARDVARAFAWARRNARAYGGDPDRIVLCGHSAGAHLVSLVGTAEEYLRDPALGLSDGDRSALRGVIAVCGVYRIPAPDEFREMFGEILCCLRVGRTPLVPPAVAPVLARHGGGLNLFRMVFGDGEEVRRRASPLAQVRPGLPPFLVLYAAVEVPRLAGMAADFSEALTRAGTEAELREVPGCTHNTILFRLGRPGDAAGPALLRFVDRCAAAPAPWSAGWPPRPLGRSTSATPGRT